MTSRTENIYGKMSKDKNNLGQDRIANHKSQNKKELFSDYYILYTFLLKSQCIQITKNDEEF